MATQTLTKAKEEEVVVSHPERLDGGLEDGRLEELLGGGGVPPSGGAGDGREPGGGAADPAMARTAVMGTWALVAAVTMLFVGFTSTYLVRRTGPGWLESPMPAILYLNTAVILASSGVLERARRRGRAGCMAALTRGVAAALALGAVFLAGQAAAWWQLHSRGLTLAWGPHVSFFYLLSAMHALHLLAGLGWLALGWARSRRALAYGEVRPTVEASAVFWHFIGALWVYLWILLFWV